MFRVSQHPSSGVLKTVPAASGTGHTTCTYSYFPPTWSDRDGVSIRQFLILLMMGAVTPETCRVVWQWINICILLHLLDFYSRWITMHGIMSLKNLVTDVFGQPIGPIFNGLAVHWRWDRYVIPKRRYVAVKLRSVTSRKSEDLLYTTTVAWNQARLEWSELLCFTGQGSALSVATTERVGFGYIMGVCWVQHQHPNPLHGAQSFLGS